MQHQRRIREAVLSLLTLLGAMLVAASPVTFAHAQPQDFQIDEIAPGVFVHIGEIALMTKENEGAIANVGFVIGDTAVAVIDTGGSVAEGRKLLAAIRSRTDKPIRYVINTHAHPDHIFGDAAFQQDGTIFVGSPMLHRALVMRGALYIDAFRRIMGAALIDEVRLVSPTLIVGNVMSLDIGGRGLILLTHQTAHSDSDLTVYDPTSKTLFAGDLVFVKHIPVVDGSLVGFLKTVDGLQNLPARRVVPGHGPVSAWPDALDSERRYLTTLARDVRAMIAAGQPIADAASHAAQSERQNWDLFDDYNARNATAAFSELEWE